MDAIQATLEPYKNAEPTVADDPEKRLLARIALAERQYAEGKYRPARDIIADLRAKNRA